MSEVSLDARSISFSYNADRTFFDGWSYTFREGDFVAITGRSGRGKSTLLYILGLMLKATAGQISVGSELISEVTSDRRRSQLRAGRFGFVFQDAALDPSRSVQDNIIETALYNGLDRRTAIHRARLLLDRYSIDVDPTRKPGQVSGGQAQRIALCRAMLAQPRIIIADEPTGNLDRATSATVLESFEEHASSGGTVIVATHDAEVAAAATKCIEL